jgi:DNA-binding SARP family transcriptional activator
MVGRVGIARRIAFALAASALLVALLLAWEVRPALPGLPHSMSAPLTHDEIGAVLSVLAWAVFVLLDLVLLARVVEVGSRRHPTQTELRLKRALERRSEPVAARTPPDWRAFAHTIEPPVFRLTAVQEAVPVAVSSRPERAPSAPQLAETGDDQEEKLVGGGISVRVLGPFQLVGTEHDQPQRKAAIELIAYLAVQPQGATRDELLEVLWPDDDPRRSEQRFWQASAEARKVLDGGLRREHGRYILDRERIVIDLDELEDTLAQAAKADEADQQREALERALRLFRGEPFAGIETAWAEGEARRLRALAVDILDRLGRLRLEAGEATAALDAAERGIALDLLNESLWRLALEAEGALGLREAIAERYQSLCQLLGDRLGLEPDRETRLLHRRLLSQDPAPG